MWLSVGSRPEHRRKKVSCSGISVATGVQRGEGAVGQSLARASKQDTKHSGTKGLAQKEGGFRGPWGRRGGGEKMFQDLSIELLDFAATLWPDFRKTG